MGWQARGRGGGDLRSLARERPSPPSPGQGGCGLPESLKEPDSPLGPWPQARRTTTVLPKRQGLSTAPRHCPRAPEASLKALDLQLSALPQEAVTCAWLGLLGEQRHPHSACPSPSPPHPHNQWLLEDPPPPGPGLHRQMELGWHCGGLDPPGPVQLQDWRSSQAVQPGAPTSFLESAGSCGTLQSVSSSSSALSHPRAFAVPSAWKMPRVSPSLPARSGFSAPRSPPPGGLRDSPSHVTLSSGPFPL